MWQGIGEITRYYCALHFNGVNKWESVWDLLERSSDKIQIKPDSRQPSWEICKKGTANASDLLHTQDTSKEKPQFAEVIAVGPGGDRDGKTCTMCVKVGDKVVISNYAGSKIKVDGEELIIVNMSDILAIIE